MKYQETSTVLGISISAPEHIIIHLKCPKIAKISKPGQFVMVKCGTSTDPLLRRPISVHETDKKRASITLLFRVIGKGTQYLSSLKKGDNVDLIGPLGNSFGKVKAGQIPVLIGGGAGIAPLLPLGKLYRKKSYVIIGSNTKKATLAEKQFKSFGCKVMVTTDDGTYGIKGRVTDALAKIKDKNLKIFACGPKPMIKALKKVCLDNKFDGEASLEEWMACGIGACNGCVVETVKGYQKVCSDGPIFNIKELSW